MTMSSLVSVVIPTVLNWLNALKIHGLCTVTQFPNSKKYSHEPLGTGSATRSVCNRSVPGQVWCRVCGDPRGGHAGSSEGIACHNRLIVLGFILFHSGCIIITAIPSRDPIWAHCRTGEAIMRCIEEQHDFCTTRMLIYCCAKQLLCCQRVTDPKSLTKWAFLFCSELSNLVPPDVSWKRPVGGEGISLKFCSRGIVENI